MITVSLPITKPTGLTASVVSGGTLAANTTYYLVVAAFDSNVSTVFAIYEGRGWAHSPISDEVSVTTTDTSKSIQVDWDSVPNAATYCVYISTTSGDYTESYSQTVIAPDYLTVIGNSFLVDSVRPVYNSVYISHSIQLKNNLVNSIDKRLGQLKIEFTGNENHSLVDVYTAIIAAGYSEYVYYDGYNFTLKGGFYFKSGTGSFIVTSKNITLIKGYISLLADGYTVRFGEYIDNITGADITKKCRVDIQSTRNCFWSGGLGVEVYGCDFNVSEGVSNLVPEYLSNITYNGGWISYIGGNLSQFQFNTVNANSGLRSVTSEIRNLDNIIESYVSDVDHINVSYKQLNYMHTSANSNIKFYNCKFKNLVYDCRYYNDSSSSPQYIRSFYDCEFPYRDGNRIVVNWSANAYGSIARVYNSINLRVKDKDGNPIEGATISINDYNSDTEITKYHYNPTDENKITGLSDNNVLVSDSNGEAYCYIHTYDAAHMEGGGNLDTNYIENIPFFVTVKKEGYADYIFVIDEINKVREDIIIMNEVAPIYIEKMFSAKLITTNNLNATLNNIESFNAILND